MSLVCLVCVYSMSPFCNKLLNMSENGNDNVEMEQLREVMQPTLTKLLVVEGVLPRTVQQGNNMDGHRKYTIKLREWLGRAASIERSKILASSPKKKQPAFLRAVLEKVFSKKALDDARTFSKLKQMLKRAYKDFKNGRFKESELYEETKRYRSSLTPTATATLRRSSFVRVVQRTTRSHAQDTGIVLFAN